MCQEGGCGYSRTPAKLFYFQGMEDILLCLLWICLRLSVILKWTYSNLLPWKRLRSGPHLYFYNSRSRAVSTGAHRCLRFSNEPSLHPNTWSITFICIVLQPPPPPLTLDPPLPPPLSSTASLSVSTHHTHVCHTSMDARIKSLPVSSNIPAQTDWPLLPVDRQGEQQSWRHLWGSNVGNLKQDYR